MSKVNDFSESGYMTQFQVRDPSRPPCCMTVAFGNSCSWMWLCLPDKAPPRYDIVEMDLNNELSSFEEILDRAEFDIGEIIKGELVDRKLVYDQKKTARAERYMKALQGKPHDASAWYNLGVAGGGVIDGNQISKDECLEQALKLQPPGRDSLVPQSPHVGMAKARLMNMQYYTRALQQDPTNVDAWLEYANAVTHKDSKLECFKQVLELDSDNAKAWYQLGLAGGASIDGEQVSSNGCFEKCLSLQPDFAEAWNELGLSGGGMVAGEEVSKVQCFQTALTLKLNYVDAWTNLGDCGGGMVTGRKASKTECYEIALLLDQRNSTAWCNLALLGGGVVAGTFVLKQQCYEKTVELRPELAEAWYNLGLLGGGQVQGVAISPKHCFEKSVENKRDFALAWANLGIHGGGKISGKEVSKL